jgi:hypothetical protein
VRYLICSVVTLFLVQCATVDRGPMQRIHLESKPPGASVKLIDCGVGSTDRATTPATVFVNRRATRCALTLTLPEHGSRTVVLVRHSISTKEEDLRTAAEIVAQSEPVELLVMAPVYGAFWVIGRGIDAISGARYEQNRTRIMVDFTRPPALKLMGRYRLVAVNGKEVPATTWTLRGRDCEIQTISGWLLLEEGDNWSSVFTEEEWCGGALERRGNRTAQGIFAEDGERILLESQGFVDSAVLQGDRLELTVRGYGFRHGQTVVYTFTPLQ